MINEKSGRRPLSTSIRKNDVRDQLRVGHGSVRRRDGQYATFAEYAKGGK